MRFSRLRLLLLLRACAPIAALALAGGCDPQEDDEDTLALREAIDNGVALNSARLNGWHLNGWHLNGEALNGWHLNGWHLNGWHLDGVTLSGTLLKGQQIVDGAPVPRSGLEFIGSELTLVRDGAAYTLRIDDIDPATPGSDVYLYRVSVRAPGQTLWKSLCYDAAGQPTEAIPLANHWDPETGARIDDAGAITLACRGAVLAKCVEWGYRPWATRQSCDAHGKNCKSVSLRDHHQSCTRMARADYCGDGTPHTLDGTPIDVYDRLGPPVQAQASMGLPQWGAEAEWGPDGALCLGPAQRLEMLESLGDAASPPPCFAALPSPSDCGKLPAKRPGKLANAYCPGWLDDPDACASANDDKKKKK